MWPAKRVEGWVSIPETQRAALAAVMARGSGDCSPS